MSSYNELITTNRCKSSTLITILATFLLVGCSKQQSTLDKQLDEAEKIIEVIPDSASSILENIASPEQLDDLKPLHVGVCYRAKSLTKSLISYCHLINSSELTLGIHPRVNPMNKYEILIYLGLSMQKWRVL